MLIYVYTMMYSHCDHVHLPIAYGEDVLYRQVEIMGTKNEYAMP